jgi:hypothetical protein
MRFGRSTGRSVGIMALVSAATLGLSLPAEAAASSSVWVNTGTPKTRAGEALFNRSNGTHGNKAWFDVNDTKCDASAVYLYYTFITEGVDREQKEVADGGCGSSAGFNLKSGYFKIKFRICVKTGTFTSKCSDERTDHN